jgi:addiction module HigA family antidote
MGKNGPKEKLRNIHPGEILREEFMEPLGITAYRLSKETGIPQTRVSLILREKRAITADTALRFAAFFGNSARFWLGLQEDFDLEAARDRLGEDLIRIRPRPAKVPAAG